MKDEKTCKDCTNRQPRSDPGRVMVCNVMGNGKGAPVAPDHPACFRFSPREDSDNANN